MVLRSQPATREKMATSTEIAARGGAQSLLDGAVDDGGILGAFTQPLLNLLQPARRVAAKDTE